MENVRETEVRFELNDFQKTRIARNMKLACNPDAFVIIIKTPEAKTAIENIFNLDRLSVKCRKDLFNRNVDYEPYECLQTINEHLSNLNDANRVISEKCKTPFKAPQLFRTEEDDLKFKEERKEKKKLAKEASKKSGAKKGLSVVQPQAAVPAGAVAV